ncbi:hypothetical protein HS961_04405 [Comamonas piscis]|uniref:Uncharacterized protein n=1 Tax=Comamonas piscis TaxID=1562974 RepID=A0A7G5EDR0_9BURK|nr:hypothetical protein [Comamonas piscis]QMV72135.1 hypothetical protein HS961_04405 [Comamonas piscis]WSO34885.1 hypothetical protein VUJ63_04430 [Comamonas piscis]
MQTTKTTLVVWPQSTDKKQPASATESGSAGGKLAADGMRCCSTAGEKIVDFSAFSADDYGSTTKQ